MLIIDTTRCCVIDEISSRFRHEYCLQRSPRISAVDTIGRRTINLLGENQSLYSFGAIHTHTPLLRISLTIMSFLCFFLSPALRAISLWIDQRPLLPLSPLAVRSPLCSFQSVVRGHLGVDAVRRRVRPRCGTLDRYQGRPPIVNATPDVPQSSLVDWISHQHH